MSQQAISTTAMPDITISPARPKSPYFIRRTRSSTANGSDPAMWFASASCR